MKKTIFTLTIASSLLLAACGEETADPNDREVTSGEEAAADVSAEESTEKEPTESKVGVRSNPLPMGDTITAETVIYDDGTESYPASLDLAVTEVIRGQEAWDIIYAENEFNEPAAEGYEYILTKVKATLKDAETEDYPLWISSSDFQYVDQEGAAYELFSVVTPQELSTELFNGGSTEGYIANQVKVGDDTKLTFTSTSGAPIFFNIK